MSPDDIIKFCKYHADVTQFALKLKVEAEALQRADWIGFAKEMLTLASSMRSSVELDLQAHRS